MFIIISFQEAIKASLCGSDVDDSTNDAKPQMESGRNPCGPCGSNQYDTIVTTVNRRDGETSLGRAFQVLLQAQELPLHMSEYNCGIPYRCTLFATFLWYVLFVDD